MPLITICGIPLSGKTRRAEELARFISSYIETHASELAEKNLSFRTNVIIVNEEFMKLDKWKSYEDSNEEKKARGAIMSAVERHLTKEDIVICDSLNYIKGYRYQLYCVARALGTPSCTLVCGMQTEEAERRNMDLKRYDQPVLSNLCSRFEDPDGRNRWDAPLFTVISQDEPLDTPDNQIAIKIVESTLFKKAPPPNLSTVVKPLAQTNYLHEMDKTTSDIVDAIIEAQKNGIQGMAVVPKSSKKVQIPSRTLTLSELRRIRRDFTKINKLHTQIGTEVIADTFVEFLNTNLN